MPEQLVEHVVERQDSENVCDHVPGQTANTNGTILPGDTTLPCSRLHPGCHVCRKPAGHMHQTICWRLSLESVCSFPLERKVFGGMKSQELAINGAPHLLSGTFPSPQFQNVSCRACTTHTCGDGWPNNMGVAPFTSVWTSTFDVNVPDRTIKATRRQPTSRRPDDASTFTADHAGQKPSH